MRRIREDVLDIVGGVGVVVVEGVGVQDFAGGGLEHAAKGGGVADGGGGGDFQVLQVIGGEFVVVTVAEAGPVLGGVGGGRLAGEGLDLAVEHGELIRGDEVAAGEDDGVGAAEVLGGLAQQTPGQEVVEAEGSCRVDEDDVQVAVDLAVLEAVI